MYCNYNSKKTIEERKSGLGIEAEEIITRMMVGILKILAKQHLKKVKVVIKIVVGLIMTIEVVETIEEKMEKIYLTREMSNDTIVKSFGTLLINAMTKRKIHKNINKRFLGKKMMTGTPC